MIVAAHPDDAELAMGGTIAKMIESGWDTIIVDLTDGEPTPYGTKELRKKETDEANNVLGIEKRICLDMPNRYLQATLENRKKLAEVIRINLPDLLFGPVVPDYHPDHVETAKLIESARFEAKFHKTDMKGSPHWAPIYYNYYSTHRMYYGKPSFIVDITSQWDKKIRSIQAYKSQVRYVPSSNQLSLFDKVEVICSYFGQCIGSKYAEPFFDSEPLFVKNLNSISYI